MADNLTEEKIPEFKEAFSVFDKDSDGIITTSDLRTLLTNIGTPATDLEFQELLMQVDGSGVGTIEFSIFISIMPR